MNEHCSRVLYSFGCRQSGPSMPGVYSVFVVVCILLIFGIRQPRFSQSGVSRWNQVVVLFWFTFVTGSPGNVGLLQLVLFCSVILLVRSSIHRFLVFPINSLILFMFSFSPFHPSISLHYPIYSSGLSHSFHYSIICWFLLSIHLSHWCTFPSIP